MRIDVFFDVYPHPAKPYFESQLTEWHRQGHELRLFSFGGIAGIRSAFSISFIRTLRERPLRLALAILWRGITLSGRSWRTFRSQSGLAPAIKALAIDAQLPRTPPEVHFVHNLATAVWLSYLKSAYPEGRLAIYYHGGEIPGLRQIPLAESARALGQADIVFSNTRASVREAEERGAQPSRTACIPVGFPLDRFQPPAGRTHLPGNRWRFVCLGRMAREKGFDVTLRALATLRSRRDDFHLSFIGEGPELQSLKALTEQLSLGERVSFFGYVESYQDVIDRLAEFDVLIFSGRPVPGSNFRDTQATVMQEAMLMGTIVVASDIGGIRESLPAALRQYLYTPGSMAELTERLSSVMELGAEELRSLSGAARRFVEENYDVRTINERLLGRIADSSPPPEALSRTLSPSQGGSSPRSA